MKRDEEHREEELVHLGAASVLTKGPVFPGDQDGEDEGNFPAEVGLSVD